jgi:hypothetical protein
MPKTLNKQTYCADMAILVDELISPNIGRTPEGYLICKDVKVARIGTQRYLGQEIGQDEAHGQMFDVYRLPDDVFAAETIASFEGKPITDGHPPGYFVAPNNFAALAKGHAQNARKMGDFIVMDLIINDPILISKVENKVIREVSMGYSCHYAPHGDTFKQIEIRGNHIAIVDKGRAGKKVAIKDEKPKGKKHMKDALKTKIIDSLVAADADAETIVEAMQLFSTTKTVDSESNDKAPSWLATLITALKPKAVKDEDADEDKDDKEDKETTDRITKLEAGQKQILDAINGLKKVTDEDGDEDEDKDKEETTDEDGDDDDDDKDKKETSDAAIKKLRKELKPILAGLPAKDRDAIKATLDGALGKKAADKNNAYAKIQEIIAKSSKTRTGDASTVDHVQRGKDIAAKYNTGYRHLKVADNK